MRVLIADDEKIIANTLATIFRIHGMDALAVHSGEHAIEVAKSFAPDVLICDVDMGAVNGFEVGIFFRRHLPDCRVLLFSGCTHAADALPGTNTGGHRFELISKPVHPKILLAYVGAGTAPDTPVFSREQTILS